MRGVAPQRIAPRRPARRVAAFALLWALAACAAQRDPWSYRLGAGEEADAARLAELRPRYAAFFDVVLDPSETRAPDLAPLQRDLERAPVDRRNFAALEAVALGYFALNRRAASAPRGASSALADSFRAAELLALPWRAYGATGSGRLRNAILAFFEDAGSGEARDTARAAPRLAPLVASLEATERDESRRRRIRALAHALAGYGAASP